MNQEQRRPGPELAVMDAQRPEPAGAGLDVAGRELGIGVRPRGGSAVSSANGSRTKGFVIMVALRRRLRHPGLNEGGHFPAPWASDRRRIRPIPSHGAPNDGSAK